MIKSFRVLKTCRKTAVSGQDYITELEGVVVTIAGKLLAHKLYHFRLEWSHLSWMWVVLGGESFTALAEGL